MRLSREAVEVDTCPSGTFGWMGAEGRRAVRHAREIAASAAPAKCQRRLSCTGLSVHLLRITIVLLGLGPVLLNYNYFRFCSFRLGRLDKTNRPRLEFNLHLLAPSLVKKSVARE